MVVIKKVGILSFAKIQTLFFVLLGLLEGIMIAVLTAFAPEQLAAQAQDLPQIGLGYAAIIVMPIIYAIVGFVLGIIGAWLYNVFAKWVGGIEVEIEKPAVEPIAIKKTRK